MELKRAMPHYKAINIWVHQPGASFPEEAMVRFPKMPGWVPQFLIIMHLKCCAERRHDLPVLWQLFWN